MTSPFHEYQHFLPCDHDFGVKHFNLIYNFWTLSAGDLMFHTSIPCDETLTWVPSFLSRDIRVWTIFEIFNLDNNV